MKNGNKSKGQYFTPKYVADFMVDLISHKDPVILEPSAGEGVFIQSLVSCYDSSSIVAIEIDPSLTNRSTFPILYQDFFDYPVKEKFDVVIGNPPYIRWKHQSKVHLPLLILVASYQDHQLFCPQNHRLLSQSFGVDLHQ